MSSKQPNTKSHKQHAPQPVSAKPATFKTTVPASLGQPQPLAAAAASDTTNYGTIKDAGSQLNPLVSDSSINSRHKARKSNSPLSPPTPAPRIATRRRISQQTASQDRDVDATMKIAAEIAASAAKVAATYPHRKRPLDGTSWDNDEREHDDNDNDNDHDDNDGGPTRRQPVRTAKPGSQVQNSAPRLLQQPQAPDDSSIKFTNTKQAPRNSASSQPASSNQATKSTTTTKSSHLALPLPYEPKPQPRPYPKKVFFIIANEFCERFSYYGLRAVLVLYFSQVLGFTDSAATVSYHLFITLCYVTPILGAVLGDSVWGKFKTVLYLSIVYFVGELVLVVSSVFWHSSSAALTITMTFAGLLLIGTGTGGIKPCVSALGGDQFLAHEQYWRENFFSLFYAAINIGALLSNIVTPILRSNYECVDRSDCYPLAFGLPCALMLVSIVVFAMAHRYYVIVPLPENNVIAEFCRCVWLALTRKLAGTRLQPTNSAPPANTANTNSGLVGHFNASMTSDSNASLNSYEPVLGSHGATSGGRPDAGRDHWLYLASDTFDHKSIEDFKSVIGIMLLLSTTPIFWCLFDQQGSLWTLQATRMDGRVLNTNIVIEPDQMSVANPLLLLACIFLFQFFIYPSLARCNVLTSPIQRMTTGGLLAALAFVASALLELQIQASVPSSAPSAGHANLLLVNGLSDCLLVTPSIVIAQPDQQLNSSAPQNSTLAELFRNTQWPAVSLHSPVRSLAAQNFDLNLSSGHSLFANSASASASSGDAGARAPNVQLKFKLANTFADTNATGAGPSIGGRNTRALIEGCPFDTTQLNRLPIGPVRAGTNTLLYVEHANGRLTTKLFNDSRALAADLAKARVALLFEFFGSHSQASKLQFHLTRVSKNTAKQGAAAAANHTARSANATMAPNNNRAHEHAIQFNMSTRDGQVLLSEYVDVSIGAKAALFALTTSDADQLAQSLAKIGPIQLKPGTRNLIVLHQRSAQEARVALNTLQDNDYRVSMLYQLVPYVMISASEVMFSITGLEFCYASAPETMKSLILGLWSLTTALGNLLTVAVESVHPFTNVVHDFFFYAALMAVDMMLFAILGYNYRPPSASVPSK